MKVTINGWVHCRKYPWESELVYEFWTFKMETSLEYTPMFEHQFEVEVPDKFDPTPMQIEVLRATKQSILAESQVKANNIDQQIQELLCIESQPNTDAMLAERDK